MLNDMNEYKNDDMDMNMRLWVGNCEYWWNFKQVTILTGQMSVKQEKLWQFLHLKIIDLNVKIDLKLIMNKARYNKVLWHRM